MKRTSLSVRKGKVAELSGKAWVQCGTQELLRTGVWILLTPGTIGPRDQGTQEKVQRILAQISRWCLGKYRQKESGENERTQVLSIHHLVQAQALRLSIKSTYSPSRLTGSPSLFIGTLIFGTVITVQTVKEMKRKSPTHSLGIWSKN